MPPRRATKRRKPNPPPQATQPINANVLPISDDQVQIPNEQFSTGTNNSQLQIDYAELAKHIVHQQSLQSQFAAGSPSQVVSNSNTQLFNANQMPGTSTSATTSNANQMTGTMSVPNSNIQLFNANQMPGTSTSATTSNANQMTGTMSAPSGTTQTVPPSPIGIMNQQATANKPADSHQAEASCSNESHSNVNSILDAVFSAGCQKGSSKLGREPLHCPGELIANLNASTVHVLAASLAPSSRVAYRRSWHLFETFKQQELVLPVSVSDVCNFIGHLFHSNLSSSTISSHVSALGYVHKILNLSDPTQAFIIKKLLRGCHKLSQSSDCRLPITKNVLSKLVAALNHTEAVCVNRIMLAALFKLCFHAFLRLGEVVVKSGGLPHNVIQRQHVTFQFQGNLPISVHLILHHYKNQKHNEPFTIMLERSKDTLICPVLALHNYLLHFKHSSGPLFQLQGGFPVTYSYVSTQLANAARFSGLNPDLYKGHSFRIGAATHATTLGYSEHYIKQLGRWNSNAFRRYVRIPSFNV